MSATSVPSSTLRVALELDGEPIRGVLTGCDARPIPFRGWMELAAAVERCREDAIADERARAPDEPTELDPGVDIGHVHLKVADLDRAVAFYRDVLGFTEQGRLGDRAAFLSAGGYHHHIALNTFESRDGGPPPPGTTGLFHAAIRYPSRAALARALRRLRAHGVALTGARDHGASEALYLDDPDGNGLELTWDRPRRWWPRTADGRYALINQPLDVEALASIDDAEDALR